MRRMGTSNLPIVIGGFYRSGTSLLRRLLDAHSKIHCPPEIKFFKDFYGDYLNDELAHARLFSTLPSMGLDSEECLRLFGGAFVKAHELAARKAGKARWADKNPENVLYLDQWRHLLPEGFLFVHMVRDPLDALASLVEVGFPKAVPPALMDKARLYKEFRDAGVNYVSQYPENSITVSYESLVEEPEATLKRLFAFIGEDYEPDVLTRFTHPERGHGIEDPKVGKTSRIHADSVGRGQENFSEDEINGIHKVLGRI